MVLMPTSMLATCPTLSDYTEFIVTNIGVLKFQVGQNLDIPSMIAMGNWVPLYAKVETEQAMIDKGFAYTLQSSRNGAWADPKLTPSFGYGYHDDDSEIDADYKIEIDFGGNFFYVHKLILMRRGNNASTYQVLSYV